MPAAAAWLSAAARCLLGMLAEVLAAVRGRDEPGSEGLTGLAAAMCRDVKLQVGYTAQQAQQPRVSLGSKALLAAQGSARPQGRKAAGAKDPTQCKQQQRAATELLVK